MPKSLVEELGATLADRRVRRSVWGLVLAVAVLGVVLGAEVTFLSGPITKDLGVLKGSAGTGASKAPAAQVLAPPSAGPIEVVDLRALSPCSPGGSCELTLVVGARQGARPLRVAWQLEALSRCTSAQASLGRGELTVAADQSEAAGLASASLPRWPLLDLVVLTTSPARAASTPLTLPASGGSC